MKRILLIGTGGTIACKRSADGLRPVLTSDELLSFVPSCREYCQVDTRQILGRAVFLLFPGVTADTDKRDFGRIGPLT